MKLYVDGVGVASSWAPSAMNIVNQPVVIGAYHSGNNAVDAYFDGDIDETAIFNRALTATEIQTMYNNGLNGIGYCTPSNVAPVANAGADQSAYVNDTVTLDGTGSTDVDGDLLTYTWALTSKPNGSTSTLIVTDPVKPTFTVDKAGTYVVSLTVNDNTINSVADTVTISTLNSAPVANAGADQSPYVTEIVTLNGSGSTDVDGDLLTYTWAFTAKPQDSNAELDNVNSVNPTFTVDKTGTYVVSLVVNDGTLDSNQPDTVTISTLNSAPVANAGTDQLVYVNNPVTLDGSGSTDVDGDLLTCTWAFTAMPNGSTATLSDSSAVNPTFTVDKAGTYVVSLVVNDGTLDSQSDTVVISTIYLRIIKTT